jgi:hypothetical protein
VWRLGITIGNNYVCACGTIVSVNVSDDLPNSPHLKVNDAVELLTGYTKFPEGRRAEFLSPRVNGVQGGPLGGGFRKLTFVLGHHLGADRRRRIHD